mmetsp:Transcript_13147/g.19768  ORF Transcript_13147/g.19768 Transcript_13147/m.19768 type:complete len:200 (+) Transcript_13147:653-1252(+)
MFLFCEYMIAHRGRDRSSFIAGSSTHNNRIERLWRDMRIHTTQAYMELFKSFEMEGMDLTNILHIYTLQYLFIPRIQYCLQQFINTWNNHKMRTENNYSPLQLLTNLEGFIAADVQAVDEDNYGLELGADDSGDNAADNDVPLVECNAVECPLNNEQLCEFRDTVQPISLNDSFEMQRNKYFDGLLIINDIFYHQSVIN